MKFYYINVYHTSAGYSVRLQNSRKLRDLDMEILTTKHTLSHLWDGFTLINILSMPIINSMVPEIKNELNTKLL